MAMRLTSVDGRDISEGNELPREPAALIHLGGTKWVLDGTPLEPTTAALNPYDDRPGTFGSMNFSESEMEQMLRESAQQNDQLIVHILKLHTIETFLDAMQETGGGEVW